MCKTQPTGLPQGFQRCQIAVQRIKPVKIKTATRLATGQIRPQGWVLHMRFQRLTGTNAAILTGRIFLRPELEWMSVLGRCATVG